MNNEDVLPPRYPYYWSKESDLSLEDFLMKYKPSMVQNDGTKHWIWVRGSEPTREDTNTEKAVAEASKILQEVTDKVQAIKNDESIPMRSNKKTGKKSKKEVREQVQAEATENLKELATRYGYVSGKWLIFASASKVDMIWTSLATSLLSGPLSSTSAYLAKVATSPEQDNPNHQHLICVYLSDIFDRDSATEVMKVLLRHHGVTLSGAKSNLYTEIGIDSKHPSGIPSTTWKNTALLSEAESKELRDAFFADLASHKTAVPEEPLSSTKDDAAPVVGKVKPKLKKKVPDDPFASDENNDDNEEEKQKPEIKAKVRKVKSKTDEHPLTSSDDEANVTKGEGKEKITRLSGSKRKQHSDEEGDEQPRKKINK